MQTLPLQKMLGLPDLLEVESVLVVEPHPDDNEVGAGATIKLLTNRDIPVIYVTVTDGGAGGIPKALSREETIRIRQQERYAANRLLAITASHNLGFPDGGSWTERDLVMELVPLIRQYRPDLVMTIDPCTPYAAHPDHVKTGRATSTAATVYADNALLLATEHPPYSVPQIAFYGTAYPNRFIDVTATWEDKLRAMQAHVSQFDTPDWPLLSTYLTGEAERLYHEHYDPDSNGYVEAFKVLSTRQLHFFPQAVRS